MEDNKKIPERFQDKQSTDSAMSADNTVTPDHSFDIKENKASGSVLKQEVAASVINKGKGTGGGVDSLADPVAFGLRRGKYTGDSGAYLGSAAGTPSMNTDNQGSSRLDKKLSDANKDINLNASEQYATYFTEEPALREQKGTVGRNGNPSNVSVRSQKKTGFTPAEPLYDRSVDEIRNDNFIFTMGQVVKQEDVVYNDYPTINFERVVENGKASIQETTFNRVRGNFSPRFIKVRIAKDSGGTFVKSFGVIEDSFPSTANYHDINDASVHQKTDLNMAEMSRQFIDNKHGNPDQPNYSPLGRSVAQPSATVMYLRDVEANTGAIMASCLRFANKARAYYLNRTGKDGQEIITPGLDALYGHLFPNSGAASLRTALGSIDGSQPFYSAEGCRRGSAYTLIRTFDSGTKFKTKADIVNQPRGLKLCLQTGMNNHAPLRYKKEFMKFLNAIDVYSTIDRGYDPSSSVMISDGLRYVMPYSWTSALAYTRSSSSAAKVYSSKVFMYRYQAGDGNQGYYVKVADPILNGVAWFIEQHKSAIFDTLKGNSNLEEVEWIIPVVSYSTRFSLFDLIVSASASYIEYERTNALKDIIDLDTWGDYPFSDLEKIDREGILNPSNYGKISPVDYLNVGEMKPANALRWLYPEIFYRMPNCVMLPFYFNQRDYTLTASSMTANGKHSFTTPTIRSGVHLATLDDFFGMDARDVLFTLDRLVHIPTKPFGSSIDAIVYKYAQNSDGIPCLLEDTYSSITVGDVHKTPRQLGWIMPAFLGECRIVDTFDDLSDPDDVITSWVTNAFSKSASSITAAFPSFMARMYKALPGDEVANPKILGANSQNVDRAQAFAQTWYDRYVNDYVTSDSDFDVALSAAECISGQALVADESIFVPFVNGEFTNVNASTGVPTNVVTGDDHKVFSMMRAYWARIQKIPFVINPFDVTSGGTVVDPFDFAYMFGLAGFYAANYDEEIQNRELKVMSEQFSFTEDPFTAASPLG